MSVGETALPVLERRFQGEFLYPLFTETTNKANVSGQAILVNAANTNLAGKDFSLIDYPSSETAKKQCVITGRAILLAEDNPSTVGYGYLTDVTYTVNPRAVSTFNFYVGSVMASLVGLWSPDLKPIRKVFQRAAPKHLEKAYRIGDGTKVGSFIEQNRLTDILISAIGPLNKSFGESLTKTLTVVEDDEGTRTLCCLVAFPGSMQDARKALGSFDRDWWLMNARAYVGKLNFDFELE